MLKLRIAGWIVFAIGVVMIFVSTNTPDLRWLRWSGIVVAVMGMVMNSVGILLQHSAIFRKKPPGKSP